MAKIHNMSFLSDSYVTLDTSISELSSCLWDILPKDIFPSGLSTYESMWKYRLKESDYKKLREIVNRVDWKEKGILERDIEGYRKGSTNLARVAILVISEWFKRESPSLDGDNALDNLFTNPENRPDVKKIWDASGLDSRLLHQAKKMQLRQTAICVLGGFPLIYVNSSPRFERLISLLASDSKELDSSSYDDLFDKNNTVFSGSLSCGSCKEYIDQLCHFVETDDDGDLPFNVEDLTGSNTEFKKFRDLVRNGYDEKVRNDFFSHAFYFYTSDTDTDIQAQFLLRIGFKKDRSVLYAPQLKSLGIDTEGDSLYIRLVTSNGKHENEYALHRYDRVGNGRMDFAGRGRPEILINFDLFDTTEIRLEILDSSLSLLKSYSYPVPPSLELYKEPTAYCWSTIKKTSASKSILLNFSSFQDFGDCIPIEKHSGITEGNLSMWSWIHLTETIKLDDVNGVSHLFECGGGQHLAINFLKGELKDQIAYENGRIEGFLDDEQIFVHLLFGQYSDGGRNTLNIQVFSQDEKKKKETKDYILEFKEHGKYRYSRWTSDCNPEQGFISIRIVPTKKGISSYQEEVYYIPSDRPVIRDLSANTILFANVSDIYRYNSEEGNYILSGDTYLDSPSTNRNQDTVDFRIGDSEQNITLKVYRAFWLQVLKKDNKEIFREVTKSIRKIPVLMCSRFSIWTIDNSGSRNTERITPPLVDFYKDLKGPSALSSISIIKDNYSLYVYLPVSISDNVIVINNVSPAYWREYQFYFWSERRSDMPIKLETIYDDDTRILSVDCSEILDKDGVIFQSLFDCNPNNYYRPIYTRAGMSLSTTVIPHWNKIFSKEDIQYCYDLLEQHKIYSPVFSCFKKVSSDPEKRFDLLNYVFVKEAYNLKEKTLDLLSRIATECAFDWMLTPRRDILKMINRSGVNRDNAVNSFQKLFERSRLVKDNFGPHLHERYYFKRLFVEDERYFNPSVKIEQLFSDTGNRRKDMARLFVEAIKGVRSKNDPIPTLLATCSDYDNYEHLLRDVFAKYFIR